VVADLAAAPVASAEVVDSAASAEVRAAAAELAAAGKQPREKVAMKKPEDKLQELVSRLQAACGDNLVSVVLYGSAAREEFHERYSDVNLLAVFGDLSGGQIAVLGPVVRWWTREEGFTPPLMMTEVELRESADVFAIELVDLQHMHKTLFGKDVVSEVHVPMNLHRVEVEQQVRTTFLRLRQHLLLNSDDQDELRKVLAKSIGGVSTLLRHALIAVGESPTHEKPRMLEQAGAAFGFDGGVMQSVLALRSDHARPMNASDVYNAYMNAIGSVAHELEVRAPKRHLQKISSPA
jgi:predicted nucleotidyltransferase